LQISQHCGIAESYSCCYGVMLCDSDAGQGQWVKTVFSVAVACVLIQQDVLSSLVTLIGLLIN